MTKKELFQLNISNQLKQFMLRNLKEKYQYVYSGRFATSIKNKVIPVAKNGKANIMITSRSLMSNDEDEGSDGSYFSGGGLSYSSGPSVSDISINGIYLSDAKSTVNKKDYMDVQDHTWATDESFIGWSPTKIATYTLANFSDEHLKNTFNEMGEIYKDLDEIRKNKNLKIISNSIGDISAFFSGIKLISKVSALEKLMVPAIEYLGLFTSPLLFDLPAYLLQTIDDFKSHPYENIVNRVARNVLTNLTPILLTIFGGPVSVGVGLGLIALKVILDFIPSGNGHSVWSNINDHGLNDWDFQLKKNGYTMSKIALSFSEGGHYGVEWKVIDGWFTLPELYIKRQGRDEFTHLSPGSSFNYGNKVAFKSSEHDKYSASDYSIIQHGYDLSSSSLETEGGGY